MLRTLEAVRFLKDGIRTITWTWVPVDWAANALARLLLRPGLEHKRYPCPRELRNRSRGVNLRLNIRIFAEACLESV